MNYRLAYKIPGWEIADFDIADSEPDAIARLFEFDERFYRQRRANGTR